MTQGKKYSEFSLIVAGACITGLVIMLTVLSIFFREMNNLPEGENCKKMEIEYEKYNAVWRGVVYRTDVETNESIIRITRAEWPYQRKGHFTIYPESWKR